MAKPNLNRNLIFHFAIWVILFALPHLFIDSRNIRPGYFPGSWFIITNIYNVGLFYVNAFYLFPVYFNKSKWPLYFLWIALLLAVSYFAKLWLTKQFYPAVILDTWAFRVLFFPPIAFFLASIIYNLIIIKINFDKKQKEIVAEQLSFKLKFLRSQISPHFIFNVLTNLVSLARKQSKQLEPALMMLSDLMRYMLYESDENKVLLEKEIEYLKSYINLQQIRFGDDLRLDLNINLSEEILHKKIEPMLLIPFVENAYKHGWGTDNAVITVSLSSMHNKLVVHVSNIFSEQDHNKDANSGIGLQNVRSRLALLYPGKHELSISAAGEFFIVNLTLELL